MLFENDLNNYNEISEPFPAFWIATSENITQNIRTEEQT